MYQFRAQVEHDRERRRVRERYFSSDDQLCTMAMALRGPQFATLTSPSGSAVRPGARPAGEHACRRRRVGRSRPVTGCGNAACWARTPRTCTATRWPTTNCGTSPTPARQCPSPRHRDADGPRLAGHRAADAVGIRPACSIDTCVSNSATCSAPCSSAWPPSVPWTTRSPAPATPGGLLGSRDVLSFAPSTSKALGLGHKVGSLTPQAADIVLLRADTLALSPLNNRWGRSSTAPTPGWSNRGVAGRVVKSAGACTATWRTVPAGWRATAVTSCSAYPRPRDAPTRRTGGGWQPKPTGHSELRTRFRTWNRRTKDCAMGIATYDRRTSTGRRGSTGFRL